jgi:hypothetical protein
LGIFAVAALARLPGKHAHMLFDPIWDAWRNIGSELKRVIYCSSFKEGPLHEKEKPDRD